MKRVKAKKALPVILWLVYSMIGQVGCATLQQTMQSHTKVDTPKDVSVLPAYAGLKARIYVADFEVKAAKTTSEIGASLREMLLTALIKSNRFSLIELKAQEQAAVVPEPGLSAAGIPQSGDDSSKAMIKPADLVITVTVSEFEPQASGGREGLGGGGGVGRGRLGGLLATALSKAYLALDIRIVDTATSKVLATSRAQGQASDMEKAIHICIIEAVRYASQAIPASYYKH